MTTLIDDILALADVEQCLKDTGDTTTTGHCHNACTWLICKIKEAQLPDYTIFWCVGTFWGNDHSWLLVQDPDTEEETVIDLTVDQFVDREVPFVGNMTDEYKIIDSIILCMDDKLPEFAGKLG